jgi:hypothetical protein
MTEPLLKLKTQRKENQSNHNEEIPHFLTKLYQILENPEYENIIQWNDNGTSFLIKNISVFSQKVLPLYFKHNNYASFIRQLNIYDFHKIRTRDNAQLYGHSLFQKNNEEQLNLIKRKTYSFHKKTQKNINNNNNNSNSSSNSNNVLIPFNKMLHQNYQLPCDNSNIDDIINTKQKSKKMIAKQINILVNKAKALTQKRINLEKKTDTLLKENYNKVIQNNMILEQVNTNNEYNSQLKGVVSFILEILQKNPQQNNKSTFIEIEDDNDNIKCINNTNTNNNNNSNSNNSLIVKKEESIFDKCFPDFHELLSKSTTTIPLLNPESKDTNNNQGMNIDLLQTLSKNDSINVSQSYCHQETNENTNSSHKENEVSYSDVINKQTEETSCSFSPHNQHSYKDSNHIINELKLSKIFNSNSASSIQNLFG